MEEREVGITELKASLDECLEEVRNGTTLVVTDGERHVARIRPESDASKETQAVLKASGIVWSGRLPKKRKPSVKLRGTGSISDIVSENRG